MAQQCPSCGGFDISAETDRFHCLDCGNYFTYDDAEAKDGPGEPLYHPEERPDESVPAPTPTDHAELAAEAKTGDEGIDAPQQLAEAPDLPSMTKAEIADHAEEQGIEGVTMAQKKDEMIATVEEAKSGEVVSQPTEGTP